MHRVVRSFNRACVVMKDWKVVGASKGGNQQHFEAIREIEEVKYFL